MISEFCLDSACQIVTKRNNNEIETIQNLLDNMYKIDQQTVLTHAENLWNSSGPLSLPCCFPPRTSTPEKVQIIMDMKLWSRMLGQLLLNSLDDNVKRRLRDNEDKYIVQLIGPSYSVDSPFYTSSRISKTVVDGACLLRAIFGIVQSSTCSGASAIMHQVESASLKSYDQNVEKFNMHGILRYKLLARSLPTPWSINSFVLTHKHPFVRNSSLWWIKRRTNGNNGQKSRWRIFLMSPKPNTKTLLQKTETTPRQMQRWCLFFRKPLILRVIRHAIKPMTKQSLFRWHCQVRIRKEYLELHHQDVWYHSERWQNMVVVS